MILQNTASFPALDQALISYHAPQAINPTFHVRVHQLIVFEDTGNRIEVIVLKSASKCIQRDIGKQITAVIGSRPCSQYIGRSWTANEAEDIIRCH